MKKKIDEKNKSKYEKKKELKYREKKRKLISLEKYAKVPFPNVLLKKNMEKQFSKFMEMFKKL